MPISEVSVNNDVGGFGLIGYSFLFFIAVGPSLGGSRRHPTVSRSQTEAWRFPKSHPSLQETP